jgi:hypothetical protein
MRTGRLAPCRYNTKAERRKPAGKAISKASGEV